MMWLFLGSSSKTTSPHYRRAEFSVLRRFSDFLWLFEAVSNNNPGVIVPPVPDKHPFGEIVSSYETNISPFETFCLVCRAI
jgi:sorting nexin-1/2